MPGQLSASCTIISLRYFQPTQLIAAFILSVQLAFPLMGSDPPGWFCTVATIFMKT